MYLDQIENTRNVGVDVNGYAISFEKEKNEF